jgi:hypothetical protein
LAVFAVYQRALEAGLGPVYARSAAIALLVFSGAAIAAALSRLRTRTAATVCAATVLSAVVLIQAPAVAPLLHLAPLSPLDLLWQAGIAMAIGALTLVMHRRDWIQAREPQAI